MNKSFSSYEIGDKVTVYGDMPGVVSFISIELQTMSICVGRGCHKSEDTNLVIGSRTLSEVEKGWTDQEVAERLLTPRPCRWYDSDNSKRN